ncbi:DUF2796 domain containing protein [Sulfitobacter noctilucae]|uniref:zinc uptake protein ZrgA n=1 Tax=Sulfitobacter noctilucae TaxID=1342302 RepID=UPI000469164D|nr:DUF2796 domain-containing protein [Sulfitobacter noctilucae]KIN60088.1 DUF2796 domain containing protein [Sulfitobacter noctilucae]
MLKFSYTALAILAATAAVAEETRQLDAHEHGTGTLDIAFDGDRIAMELHAPGADIVGFEYGAKSAEDRAAVDAAVATLARPLDLFALPAAAGCSVIEASASLESEEDEDHDAHADDDHDHDHEEHADEGHDDDDHAAHADDDHDAVSHTEFHAEYMLKCADPAQATKIDFAYFASFPNALELEVQIISDRGATGFEVARDAPTLDLRDMF